MSYEDLVTTHPWNQYTMKMKERILSPRNIGVFSQAEAHAREMLCIEGVGGAFAEGNFLKVYWLVDGSDGMIVDAKFQVFGQSPLIAAAESACELVIGKNYDQARRIGAELIDKKLRDKPEIPAFPEETRSHLNLVLEALDNAAIQCAGIPLAVAYVSPVPRTEEENVYPDWSILSHEEKLALIEEVLTVEVRPYIELDDGGIEVQELKDKELVIAYKGACTSCFSSIGATLSTIQQIIQAKIHPDLVVVPNMDGLNF